MYKPSLNWAFFWGGYLSSERLLYEGPVVCTCSVLRGKWQMEYKWCFWDSSGVKLMFTSRWVSQIPDQRWRAASSWEAEIEKRQLLGPQLLRTVELQAENQVQWHVGDPGVSSGKTMDRGHGKLGEIHVWRKWKMDGDMEKWRESGIRRNTNGK